MDKIELRGIKMIFGTRRKWVYSTYWLVESPRSKKWIKFRGVDWQHIEKKIEGLEYKVLEEGNELKVYEMKFKCDIGAMNEMMEYRAYERIEEEKGGIEILKKYGIREIGWK